MQSFQDEGKKEVLSCLSNGIPNRTKYPPAIRNFSLSLHGHSARAYEYVRDTFGKTLPNPRTIRKWYANSDIDAEHGIREYSVNLLRKKVEENRAKGEKLVVALSFDEMAIKTHVEYSEEHGMMGYESIDEIDPKTAKPATHAIVYMVSGVNENFNFPFMYHYITALNGVQKAAILVKVVNAIISTGAIPISITFDGISSNPYMCECLGANLNVFSEDFKPYIEIEGHQIYIIYDPSHMIKLVRNTLGDKGIIYDADGNPIKWSYIEKLVQLKENSDFSSTHKLNVTHLDWKNNIMKVKLATETLSNSSADSIDFLTNIQHSSFKDAQHTAKFMRTFNDLSDAFNSKQDKFKENPIKRPLSIENAEQIFELFEKASKYILGLQIRPEKNAKLVNLCPSERKTGFIGFVISMKSVKALYEKYVIQDKILTNIPTMSLSQDHLEIFFGRIRTKGGSNNNPTCTQFKAAYRTLLGNTTLLYSRSGNVQASCSLTIYNPYSNISYISARNEKFPIHKRDDVTSNDVDNLLLELTNIEALESTQRLTDLGNYSISHYANIIEKRILTSNNFNCCLCRTVFDENQKLKETFVSKNFEGRRPCRDTYLICKSADHFMKIDLLKGNTNLNVLRAAILSSLEPVSLFSRSKFTSHVDHKLFLIKFIINEYIRIKGVYMARRTNLDQQKNRVRQRLTKLIHFYNV